MSTLAYDTDSIINFESVLATPTIERLRHSLASGGYAPLPGFITDTGLDVLRAEMHRIEEFSKRRDMLMECMENSPRHMTTVGGRTIANHSPIIANLYDNPLVIRLLEAVTEVRILEVPDPVERFVANYLHRPGDTHGAHFDDFPFALVIFVEAPPAPSHGGLLQYIAKAKSLRELDDGASSTAHHRSGDAYLLRSDTTAHRVTPLNRASRRTVLNLAYSTPNAQTIATPSASLLYD